MMKYYPLVHFIFLYINILSVADGRLKTEKIVGGNVATPGSFSYQVSIQRNSIHACGGGIIAAKFILTAAHCFIDETNSDLILAIYSIVIDIFNLNEPTNATITLKVKKLYIPMSFNPLELPDGTRRSEGDLAVVKLNKKLNLGPKSNLRQLELSEHISYQGARLKITGHGYNEITVYEHPITHTTVEQGLSDGKLRHADVDGVSDEDCNFHRGYYAGSHICARTVQRDSRYPEGTCTGDSGSPLVYENNTIVGILCATDEGCREDVRPAYYIRVSYYAAFIKNAIKGYNTAEMRVFKWKKRSCFSAVDFIEESYNSEYINTANLPFH